MLDIRRFFVIRQARIRIYGSLRIVDISHPSSQRILREIGARHQFSRTVNRTKILRRVIRIKLIKVIIRAMRLLRGKKLLHIRCACAVHSVHEIRLQACYVRIDVFCKLGGKIGLQPLPIGAYAVLTARLELIFNHIRTRFVQLLIIVLQVRERIHRHHVVNEIGTVHPINKVSVLVEARQLRPRSQGFVHRNTAVPFVLGRILVIRIATVNLFRITHTYGRKVYRYVYVIAVVDFTACRRRSRRIIRKHYECNRSIRLFHRKPSVKRCRNVVHKGQISCNVRSVLTIRLTKFKIFNLRTICNNHFRRCYEHILHFLQMRIAAREVELSCSAYRRVPIRVGRAVRLVREYVKHIMPASRQSGVPFGCRAFKCRTLCRIPIRIHTQTTLICFAILHFCITSLRTVKGRIED